MVNCPKCGSKVQGVRQLAFMPREITCPVCSSELEVKKVSAKLIFIGLAVALLLCLVVEILYVMPKFSNYYVFKYQRNSWEDYINSNIYEIVVTVPFILIFVLFIAVRLFFLKLKLKEA
jgi:hypothetical protein